MSRLSDSQLEDQCRLALQELQRFDHSAWGPTAMMHLLVARRMVPFATPQQRDLTYAAIEEVLREDHSFDPNSICSRLANDTEWAVSEGGSSICSPFL